MDHFTLSYARKVLFYSLLGFIPDFATALSFMQGYLILP